MSALASIERLTAAAREATAALRLAKAALSTDEYSAIMVAHCVLASEIQNFRAVLARGTVGLSAAELQSLHRAGDHTLDMDDGAGETAAPPQREVAV